MLDLAPYQPGLASFAQRWRVGELSLFGSALRDDFGPSSDIDLLVSFADNATWSLFDLVEMKDELEALFGRRVDLTTRPAVERSPNWIRRAAILNTARTVYATA